MIKHKFWTSPVILVIFVLFLEGVLPLAPSLLSRRSAYAPSLAAQPLGLFRMQRRILAPRGRDPFGQHQESLGADQKDRGLWGWECSRHRNLVLFSLIINLIKKSQQQTRKIGLLCWQNSQKFPCFARNLPTTKAKNIRHASIIKVAWQFLIK